MPIAPRRLALVATVLALAACSRHKPDDAMRAAGEGTRESAAQLEGVATSEAPASAPASAAAANVPAPKPAPTAFACEGGRKVELGYLVAKVTLPDGSSVQISRDPDDAAHFNDDKLSFRTRDGVGELSQGGRTVPCTAD